MFFQFQGKDVIDENTRMIIYISLTGVATLGVMLILFLPKCSKSEKIITPYEALINSIKLFMTKDMFLISLVCFYIGE